MFDGYSVFIKLSLQNQVSAGLMAMSGQFSRLQAQATALQARLNSIRAMALTGLGLTAAGAAGFYMMNKALKPAEEYAHQLNILNMTGLTHKEIAEGISDAWKNTSTVITTTATDNLKSLLDLRNVLGDWQEARKELPMISKMQAVLMSSKEGRQMASSEHFAYDMAKAIDIIGKVKTPEEFEKQALQISQVMTAFQGRVTPAMFQSVFSYARQAATSLNDEFKYHILPTMIMEYSRSGGSYAGGGSRGVGPMIAAMFRYSVQGYINKKALPELKSLGLVSKGSELKTTTSGTTVDAMKNFKQAMENPYEWIQKTVLPAIQKKYGENLTPDFLTKEISFLTRGNQLATTGYLQFALKSYTFERDKKLIEKAMLAPGAFRQALINDPQLANYALKQQWNNVMTALTVPVVTVLIPALIHLASGLNTISRLLQEYPTLAKTLTFSFIGLSGSLLFGGVVMLLSAAFSALGVTISLMAAPLMALGAPIIGIAAGLALVAAGAYKFYEMVKIIDWSSLANKVKELWTTFKNNPIGFLISAFQKLWSAISNGISAIGGVISSIGSKLSEVGKGIGSKVYDLTHPNNAAGANLTNFNSKSSPTGKPLASNNTSQTIQVASTINLDGRQIARAVTDHQVRDATRSPNYSQGFDPNMSPTPMILKGNVA